jgi:hypothetical protein
MSCVESGPSIQFCPIYAILQDGLERMFYVLEKDCFEFQVGERKIASTVAEAVLISPIIYDLISSDSTMNTFELNEETISATKFEAFLSFVRCHDSPRISREESFTFLKICEKLGNVRLSLVLLGSLTLKTSSVSPLDANFVQFCDGTVASCASQFYLFSTEQLRCLDKQILHTLLGSPFLRINTEDSLLTQFEELGEDYSDLWQYLNLSFLSPDYFTHFLETIQFDSLTSVIWSNVIERLRGHIDDSISSDRHRELLFWKQSTIITSLPLIFQEFWDKKWTLLYRGSVNGFSSSSFHDKCDGHGNTITIIETTKGFIFGGFSPSVWRSQNSGIPDASGTSFVFSLKNPHNRYPMRFALSNKSYAICGWTGYGPIFGTGHDICVSGSSCSTSLGGSYVNDTGIDGKQVFTGENNFTMKEIEVFSINL